MITAYWVEQGALRAGGLAEVPMQSEGLVWVDVLAPDAAALEQVGERFPMPPLAVEDCLHFPQRPKLDIYGDLSFIVWQIAQMGESGIETQELDVFLGEEHLVTVHLDPLEAIESVAERITHHPAEFGRGAEWILHAILDTAVDSALPIVETISDELEDLEDRLLTQALPQHQERVHLVRRALVCLHRVVTPEREVVRALARLEAFVEPDAYMYFEDIGDHLARVADEIDTYREVAEAAMDLYLSAHYNRMNALMKTPAVVATVFMPLTLIPGLWGMNFGFIPGATWQYGFYAVIAIMVLVTVGMVGYFRRHAWW